MARTRQSRRAVVLFWFCIAVVLEAANLLIPELLHKELFEHQKLVVSAALGILTIVVPGLAGTPDLVNAGIVRDKVMAIAAFHRRIHACRSAEIDVVSISAHNVDLIYKIPEIKPDAEYVARGFARELGGSGANTAYALRRMGFLVAVAGCVGDDKDGDEIERSFRGVGAQTDNLLRVPSVATGNAVILSDAQGGRQITVSPGANDHYGELIREDAYKRRLASAINRAKIVHLSSFAHHERLFDLQRITLASLKRESLLSFVPGNIQSEDGMDGVYNKGIFGRVNLLFIYEEHLERLLSRTPSIHHEVGAPLQRLAAEVFGWRLAQRSSEPLILCVKNKTFATDAERRSAEYITMFSGTKTVSDETSSYMIGEIPDAATIVDATGAGDACAAGVIGGLLKRYGTDDVCKAGYVLAMMASKELGARKGLPISGTALDFSRARRRT